MSTERTLERIDSTLEQWDEWDGHSPDAARWDGDDWIDERKPGLGYVEWPAGEAQRIAEWGDRAYVAFHAEISPFVDAMNRLAEVVMQFAAEFDAIKRRAEASTGKSWAYLVQRAQRPHSAAERTRSPQWRAGTRRTKRHARRRT